MIFTEISSEELLKFQKENNHRYYFPQSAEYNVMTHNNNNNLKTKILAVKENNEILAYGTFIYFQYKKYFYKVTAQYGPIMDYSNTELVTFYFEQLKNYYSKNLKVLCVRVNPFINEKYFNDIEYITENNEANKVNRILNDLNYCAMNEDLFTNPTLPSRCIFSKTLDENITEANLLKNVSQIARYTINRTMKEGVQVREIDIFNEEDAKIFDEINRDTENRINFEIRDNTYFKTLKNSIKEKAHYLISYIDCDQFIETTTNTIANLEKERDDLKEKLEQGKVNAKKATNRLKEFDENIAIWYKKIDKIKELKSKNGNIINLSCASFIESGQDLIYFTSGAMRKFHRYEGPYAILFHMMKYAINNNFKYFNFFGTSKDFESEQASDYGVLQFKRNFNGNIEYFMDNYEIRNAIGKIWKI
ncbi:peptidoglycan bridge formation glycyltransferase FemA/FemB family protein [uncultured Gemella sp.]|uniref:peptidoglycan bridge formation glycyltransferase FemA/FemB family protein n=1 Tax=uncultured Gemella sp. TaxID=254352 RepID=UPI0028D3E363|nr:peptidoglycan bridge formation glycyltransferase FemA/FemB family protein [uncultured Gemella sp.]